MKGAPEIVEQMIAIEVSRPFRR